MKRLSAVGTMAGILLVLSTAAFATPVSLWDDVAPGSWPIKLSINVGNQDVAEWLQPFTLPAGATVTGATLTITAKDVDQKVAWLPRDDDEVFIRQTASDPWVSQGMLTQGASDAILDTVFNLDPAWLTGDFYVKVTHELYYPDALGDEYYSNVYLQSSRLEVMGELPEPPAPVPVVPAPGAVLLASMGAGLVSLLRTRKVL